MIPIPRHAAQFGACRSCGGTNTVRDDSEPGLERSLCHDCGAVWDMVHVIAPRDPSGTTIAWTDQSAIVKAMTSGRTSMTQAQRDTVADRVRRDRLAFGAGPREI